MREAAQLVKSRGVARGGPRKDLAGCELSVNRKLQVMEYYLAKAPNILGVAANSRRSSINLASCAAWRLCPSAAGANRGIEYQ
jgi:hypothetical protein